MDTVIGCTGFLYIGLQVYRAILPTLLTVDKYNNVIVYTYVQCRYLHTSIAIATYVLSHSFTYD